MISKIEETTPFIKNFEDVAQSLLSKNDPLWLKDIRQKSLSRFRQLGLPTVRDEEWKYTNLSPIAKNIFHLPTTGQIIEKEALQKYITQAEINIVFVNGIFSKELSNLKNIPKGVTILPLEEAFQKEETTFKSISKKFDPEKETTFVVLNKTLQTTGIFIKVAATSIINNLIHIIHVTSVAKDSIVTFPRTVISLEKSSEATVLESHVAFSDDSTYLINALTDIVVEENATLHYTKAQKESQKAYAVTNTRVWQERNSNFNGMTVTTEGSIIRNNLDIILNGEGATGTLDGLYSIYKSQLVDNHTMVDHRVPNCQSNQLYKGILNDAAHAVFNGKIFVRSIAQKTNSYQLNKNLLLGKKCLVDTKPQLEISADDVKCTHGATIGQLNEDEIFYLRSRCIDKRTATKMLARGFVDDLLNTIKSDSIHQKMNLLLEPSLSAL